MPDFSTYKNLELPKSVEKYNVAVANKNNMVIDSELHKLDLKNESQDNLLATKEALNSEIARATEKENELEENINNESERAQLAENNIAAELASERNRAMTEETAISNNLSTIISELATRLNTIADSDDATLDQLSEIVAYIKNNKDLIDGITTSNADKVIAEATKATQDGNGNVITDTYALRKFFKNISTNGTDYSAAFINVSDSSYAQLSKNSALIACNTGIIRGNQNAIMGGIDNEIKFVLSTNDANSDSAIIAGKANKLSGKNNSIVGGNNNLIKGEWVNNSVIIGGSDNILSKNNSTSVNANNLSYCAIVGGLENTMVYNDYSSVILGGEKNTIDSFISNSAIIGGLNNVIKKSASNSTGTRSSVILGGRNATAYPFQVVTGHYNNTAKSLEGIELGTGTGTAFCIGNGTESATSNAIRADYNGKLWCKAAYSSTGADYAELFEWEDGNPNNEDRRGYFVTMEGDKIKKASKDDWILGIVSANPAVLGNTDMEWQGQFLKDEFGAFLMEEFKEKQKRTRIDQIINDDGDTEDVEVEYEEEITGTRYVLNPDYDPEQKYIDRISRPEWDPIGMMGVLSVYDDGSCQVNGFCSCSDNGIATVSETGYRVISRINDDIIKIVFK